MADSSNAPRRVSMAYILGFSNKPFKDGGPPVPAQPPPPRRPSTFKKMVRSFDAAGETDSLTLRRSPRQAAPLSGLRVMDAAADSLAQASHD